MTTIIMVITGFILGVFTSFFVTETMYKRKMSKEASNFYMKGFSDATKLSPFKK